MLDFGSRMTDPAAERDDADLFTAPPPADSAPEAGTEAGTEAVPPPAAAPGPAVEPAAELKPAVEPEPSETPEPTGKSLRQLLKFHHRRKADPQEGIDRRETAELLKKAREQAGLSLTDVERETQIRLRYLEALEKGDLDHMPQQVYVLAYLRKLCALYRISAEDEEVLVRPWRTVTREVPENLPGAMIVDEDRGESGGVRVRMEFYLLAAGAIVVIGVIAFLVVLTVSYFNRNQAESRFDRSELLELQARPQLTIPEQPLVRGRR